MNRLGDISAFVTPAGQLLLPGGGKTRMYTVGIVFEFYNCKQFCEYYTSQAQSHSASENWNTLKHGLNQVIEENIPTKMIKEKHNLPWITQSIKRIVRRRKRARCKARRTRSILDWECYKQLTTLMKGELKKAHSNHISNIFESNNAKQINKRAFGYIRSLKNDIVGIPSLRKSNGMMAETATDKAEVLQTQYLYQYSHVKIRSSRYRVTINSSQPCLR